MTSPIKPVLNPFARDLEYFLYIAQERSFSAAAEKLGVRQSTLSLSMKSLELRVGVTLFQRGRAGIVLTKAGNKLFIAWREIQASFQKKTKQALETGDEDLAKIGVVPHVAAKYLVPYLKKNPQLALKGQFYILPSLQIYEAIEQGQLDFGFITWTEKPKGVEAQWLRNDPVAVVGLKKVFSHIEKVQTHEELSPEPWVVLPKPQRDWTRILGAKPGFIARDCHGLREIILQGLAIGEIQTDVFLKSELKLLSFAPVPLKASPAALYLISKNGLSKMSHELRQRIADYLQQTGQ